MMISDTMNPNHDDSINFIYKDFMMDFRADEIHDEILDGIHAFHNEFHDDFHEGYEFHHGDSL